MGSQVINVTIGIGIPTLISCLLGGGTVTVSSFGPSLSLLTSLLMLLIATYALLVLPLLNFLQCRFSHTTKFTRMGSRLLLVCFALCYVVYVYQNEEG